MTRSKSSPAASALFSSHLTAALKKGVGILRSVPPSGSALMRVLLWQRHAAKCRAARLKKGHSVPPILIFGLTSRCNYSCKGCYSSALHAQSGQPQSPACAGELSARVFSRVFSQAETIGVSLLMLAGGEPLLRPDVLELAAKRKNLLSLVFTNGSLLDDRFSGWFSRHRSVIPVLSIEDGQELTDARRGPGAYQAAFEAMNRLSLRRVPFGLSLTATSENTAAVTSDDFIREHYKLGCRLFLYVEYVPADLSDRPLALSNTDKSLLLSRAKELEEDFPALFIPFPGNEEPYGGCLAAGRGFAYIGAQGGLMPCPFAPVSDRSIADMKLLDALDSPLLKTVRGSHALLHESVGGCALSSNREWLLSQVSGNPAGGRPLEAPSGK